MINEGEAIEKTFDEPDDGQGRILVQLASHFLPPSEFKIESLTLFEAKDDLQTLRKYLDSVYWKLRLAHYHASKALSAIPSAISDDEPDKQAAAFVMHVALMSGQDEGDPLGIAMIEAEAHAIAAAQAMDSVPDILSQVLYLAFRLDLGRPMREGLRTAQSVTQAFEAVSLNSVSWGLKELVSSETFEYLHAFVNITKHRSLIDKHFRWSIEDPDDLGLAIVAFRYEERNGKIKGWPSKTFKEFLEYTSAFMLEAENAILKTAESLLTSFAGSPAERHWFKLEKE
jgi:hypothetical protein